MDFFGERRPSERKCVPGCTDKDSRRFRFPNKTKWKELTFGLKH